MAAPKYNLVLQRKAPEEHPPSTKNPNPYVQVGVAFENPSGSLTLKINDGTMLDWRLQETHTIWLFLNKGAS